MPTSPISPVTLKRLDSANNMYGTAMYQREKEKVVAPPPNCAYVHPSFFQA
jgi:hypothetical protein